MSFGSFLQRTMHVCGQHLVVIFVFMWRHTTHTHTHTHTGAPHTHTHTHTQGTPHTHTYTHARAPTRAHTRTFGSARTHTPSTHKHTFAEFADDQPVIDVINVVDDGITDTVRYPQKSVQVHLVCRRAKRVEKNESTLLKFVLFFESALVTRPFTRTVA